MNPKGPKSNGNRSKIISKEKISIWRRGELGVSQILLFYYQCFGFLFVVLTVHTREKYALNANTRRLSAYNHHKFSHAQAKSMATVKQYQEYELIVSHDCWIKLEEYQHERESF